MPEKKAGEALREKEQRLETIFETASDGIVTLSLKGVITGVNRATELILDYTPGELIGNPFGPFLTPEGVALMHERMEKALRGEPLPLIFELQALRKNGSKVHLEGKASFLHEKEKPVGLVCIFRDVTVKKELEQQRADLLAMLTHNITNPLGVILGYAEMLSQEARERGSAREEDILARLRSSALTVHSLLTNYLDFSKIEAGSLSVVKVPLQINPIVCRVGQLYKAEAQYRGLSLEVRLHKKLPLIEGDPLVLERIFANLVHHALRVTPKQGQVRVSSTKQKDGVVVTVADSGPGLEREGVPSLFEVYRQAGQARHQEETGLRLFIVKALVEAHGGELEVKSVPGQGSCFWARLPTSHKHKIHFKTSGIGHRQ